MKCIKIGWSKVNIQNDKFNNFVGFKRFKIKTWSLCFWLIKRQKKFFCEETMIKYEKKIRRKESERKINNIMKSKWTLLIHFI